MSKKQITTEIKEKEVESLDALDFCTVLLKGSWLVVLCTVMFAGITYGATFLVKPLWTAEAYIDKPTTPALGNYYNLQSLYKLINGTSAAHNDEKADSHAAIINQVYQEQKRQLGSYETVRFFWIDSDYYKQQMTGNSEQDTALLERLVESIRFIEGDANKKTPDRLLLTLDNPKQATELLTAFVSYANLTTKTVLYSDITIQWKNLFEQINAASQTQLKTVQNGHPNDGTDWAGKLNMMRTFSGLDDKLNSSRYLKRPALLAFYPDRLLWASIAAVGGALFGIALVLILNLRKIRRRELTSGE